jgi:hypothetical protein
MIGTKFNKPLQPDMIHPDVPEYIEVEKTRTVTEYVPEEIIDPETGEKSTIYKKVTRTEKYKEQEENPEYSKLIPNPAPNTLSKYSEAAAWCNENNAHIEDKETYYEVVANAEPSEDEVKAARIAELKKNLADTDYIAVKIAEGAATREQYADLIAQREAWREEIRALEAEA